MKFDCGIHFVNINKEVNIFITGNALPD